MMLPALLLLAQAAAPAPEAGVPVDIDALPALPLVRRMPPLRSASDFVREEVRAGRCGPPDAAERAQTLTVDVAVLVSGEGQVRRILPRAIGCSAVEQYASGLLSRMIRRNVPAPGTPGWYRTSIAFTWAP